MQFQGHGSAFHDAESRKNVKRESFVGRFGARNPPGKHHAASHVVNFLSRNSTPFDRFVHPINCFNASLDSFDPLLESRRHESTVDNALHSMSPFALFFSRVASDNARSSASAFASVSSPLTLSLHFP